MNPLLRWLTSSEWTHIVGALLHSLWQGVILAVALALALRRLANPVTRYRCALGALGLLLIANLITWAVLNAPQPGTLNATPAPTLETAAPPAAAPRDPAAAEKVIAVAQPFQPQAKINWTAWLAMSWIFGALLMLGRTSIKVAGAEKLRRSCLPLEDERIALLVAEACHAVKLAHKLRVAVTDKLTSPAVVGVIVPTLILPLSLFTTLTPTQIQFVLLHELAHIRRGDYLANLLQLFAESVWFFNPAVWWISHQIRREREACCDAIAIELSGAPADYARTLVHVAENILQPAPAAASAFGDAGQEPSSLADRVQRLLIPGYRPALRLTWRAMLSSLCVGITLLVISALGTRNTVGAIIAASNTTSLPAAVTNRLTTTGILTTAEFEEVLASIENRAGMEITNHSSIEILPERQARLGASLTKQNTAGQIPTLIDSVGYDLAPAATFVPTPTTSTGQSIDSVLPLPIFQARQVTNYVGKANDKVPLLGDLPGLGKLFTSESAAAAKARTEAGLVQATVPLKNATVEPLIGRVFNLDVNAFYAAIRKSSGLQENVSITNLAGPLRAYFAKAGVDLDARAGKIFFFSDTRGDLSVRATEKEVAVIEKLLEPLAGIPLTLGRFQITRQILTTAQSSLSPEIKTIFSTNHAAGFRALLESFDPTDLRPKRVQYNAETGELLARATETELKQFAGLFKTTLLPNRTVEDVLAKSLDAAPQNLATRTFVVGPMELAKALGRTGPLTVTNTAEMVSACLAQAGVDLQPPRSVFFKDPLSLLLVRATPEELDALEKFLARANQETTSAPTSVKAPDRNSPENPFPSSTNLHTRTFAVDMNALTQAITQRLGTNVFSSGQVDEMKWPVALRQLFASVGVELKLPESLYLNDRKGELLVRAPLADLDAIETFLQVLNHQAPQVNIKVRWIEIPMDTDLFSLLTRPTNAAALPASRPQKLFGVLSESQTDEVLRRFRQNKGFSLVSEGQVTTLSARQAQLQVAEVKTIMTGIRPEALTSPGIMASNAMDASGLSAEVIPLGPVLGVMPIVSSDQNQISLHIEANSKEFLGYAKRAPEVRVHINGQAKKTILPLPRYLERQMTNDCVLRDGQTLVLGHLPSTEIATQPDGTIQRTDVTTSKTNNLCVLVTATLIDPAGNRLNPRK